MKAEYKEIQKQADRLFHRTEAQVDDRSHNAALAAMKHARAVLECVESDRPPRSIEDAIKRVQQSLEQIQEHPEAMTPKDADQLVEDYEELRRHCRKLPNY